jgi:hypothetical protein
MMVQVMTNLTTRESARKTRFEPTGAITQTNVQKAIEQAISTPQSINGTSINFASSPYPVLQSDAVLYVDTSGGSVEIDLKPSASRAGLPLTIKDVTGNAAANNITIKPSGAETIDGYTNANPLLVSANFGGFRLNPRTSSYTIAP